MIYKIYFYIILFISIILLICSLKFLILDYSLFFEYRIILINSSSFSLLLYFDWISLLFIRFVLFISSIVIFYRIEYIRRDKFINRFIILVIIFVVSIIFLIISPNLIRILLGWDGLGLTSYCLVIYYQNNKSFNAGILTALSNRVGDVALLLSIGWIMNFGRWNFIIYLEFFKFDYRIIIIRLFIILAAITKRAQIPFSSWLPAAIAAPTPVSSLVHSSTLVTAGVYLLIRFNYSFTYEISYLLLLIGRLTMFISGLGANFEFDFKKIIALSTLSQLGLIIRILALGSYQLSFLHLLIHALFKALLFIRAGVFIHRFIDFQDIRYMGATIKLFPITCTLFNICNFSLCGIPFISGFYSKDLIVEFISINFLNIFIYIIFYISIGLTVSYRIRLSYYLIIKSLNYISLTCLIEINFHMLKRIVRLLLIIILRGRTIIWLLVDIPYIICLPNILKFMTLIIIFIGGLIGYFIAKLYINIKLSFINIKNFLGFIWNIPNLSTLGLNYNPIFIGELFYKINDIGWIEYYGGKNLFLGIFNLSKITESLIKNIFKIYFYIMVFWIFILFIIYYLNSLCRA